MHLACSVARAEADSRIVLLCLIPTTHPSDAGTEFGVYALTPPQSTLIEEAQQTAEDYGVAFNVRLMHCCNGRLDAVLEAADAVDAAYVFAEPLARKVPLVSDMQWRHFEQGLRRAGREVFTISSGDAQHGREPLVPILRVQH